jgi:hypothetical protein
MWAAQVQFEGFHTPQKLPPLNALSKMVFRQVTSVLMVAWMLACDLMDIFDYYWKYECAAERRWCPTCSKSCCTTLPTGEGSHQQVPAALCSNAAPGLLSLTNLSILQCRFSCLVAERTSGERQAVGVADVSLQKDKASR